MKSNLIIFLTYLNLNVCISVREDFVSSPHPEWCPNATCNNGVTCNPCNRRFLFVLAQGRSGSTTLKNMINLLPGVRIGGETGYLLKNMDYLHNEIRKETSFKKGGGDLKKSWGHNQYDPHYLSCPAQSMLEALNPPASKVDDDSMTIIGIKEVKNTDESIKFLVDHFPCSRFIFNVRTDKQGSLSAQRVFKLRRTEEVNHIRISIPKLFRTYHKMLGSNRSHFMDMVRFIK